MPGDAVVVRVDRADELVATVVLAFGADPFVRWLLPDPSQFVTRFSEITRRHGERTAASGGAFARRDGRAAAFWYPPGVHPDDTLGPVLEPEDVRRVGAVWQEVAKYEPPEDHWYLRQIGVDPACQGRGHGDALLRAGLEEVDAHGQLAYLEATTHRSRDLYARHGFAVLAEVQVGDAPPLWPMHRDRRHPVVP